MLFMALMMMAGGEDVEEALKAYREKTSAEIRCRQTREHDEILVCAARDSDRYRLPLIEIDPGDRQHEGVFEEAARLQARTNKCQDLSLFLVGCGAAGIGLSVGAGGSRFQGLRPLAP